MSTVQRLLALLRHGREDSLVRNSLFMMATTVVNSLLGYVFWMVTAHSFAPDAVGVATALISAMTLTSLISELGLGPALVQFLPGAATDREWSRKVTSVLATGALAAVVAGLVLPVIMPLISQRFGMITDDPLFFGTLLVGVLSTTMMNLIDNVFVADRAAQHLLTRNALFGALKLAAMAVVGFFLPTTSSVEIVTVWALSGVVTFAVAVLVIMPRLSHRFSVSMVGVGSDVRTMAPSMLRHHITNIGAMMPMYVLPVVVVARGSAEDGAYFYITWMLGSIFFMISPSVAFSLFAEGANEPAALRQRIRSSIKTIAVLLAPVMVFFALFGHYVLELFGHRYAEAGTTLLLVLTLSAIPDATTNVYIAVCRVQHRLNEAATLNIAMGLAAAVLAWALVPEWGIAGVGWAWLMAQTAGALYAGARTLLGHVLIGPPVGDAPISPAEPELL